MNNATFNSQVYNATPTLSSANGFSVLDIGVITVSMGGLVDSKFRSTNYILKTFTNINYIKSSFTNINYIEPVFSNVNYIKG